MTRKILWIIMAVLSVLVGLYPGIYFIVERTFGLLQSKSSALLSNKLWNIGFYTHIILGGLALFIGWMQFNSKIRTSKIMLHRRIGMIYILAAMLSSIAGIYIAVFATGGLPAALGFICLGVIWLGATIKAYTEIRNGKVERHRKMMIYSYAACFSAVTLRIWLPILTMIYGDFITAYTIVAWLCWVPNILVAYLMTRQMGVLVVASDAKR